MYKILFDMRLLQEYHLFQKHIFLEDSFLFYNWEGLVDSLIGARLRSIPPVFTGADDGIKL